MKTIILFITWLFFNHSYAAEKCGSYRLSGVFNRSSSSIKDSVYIINEGTRSEARFKITRPLDLVKLSLSHLKPTTISVMIMEKMDGTSGEITQLISIDPGVLTPLNINTKNLLLLKEETCLPRNPNKH